MSYYVYMVRCEDNSYYTGIATDVSRRMAEHRSQTGRCAKYTRTHRVVELVGLWTAPDRSFASALEYRIKRLSRDRKDALVAEPERADALVPLREDGGDGGEVLARRRCGGGSALGGVCEMTSASAPVACNR